jgi:hypothetical protein
MGANDRRTGDGGAAEGLRTRAARHRMLLAALLLCGLQLSLFWPGLVEPDALATYTQAKTNIFDDWHPPIFGRLWQLFLAAGIEGTGPLFVVQAGLFWLGLGLIADAIDRRGRAGAAAGVLIVGCLPHVFGWMTMVIKDAQMTSCLIAATSILARSTLDGRALSRRGAIGIAALLGYAILVRHNTVFAAAPSAGAFAFSARRRWRQMPMAAAVLAAVGLFALSGPINRHIFGARHAYAENSLKLFDMAGTAHFAKLPTIDGIAPADWRRAEAAYCYWPAMWDSYNTEEREGGCNWIYAALWDKPLTRPWLTAILTHFPSYARHRLAHFNETLRFWTSRYNWDGASPAQSDNPNPYRIGQGSAPRYRQLMAAQMIADYTPLGRPFAWYLVGAALMLIAWRLPVGPERRVAIALLLSAGVMGLSFLVVGVAAEFRYHHWSIVAIGCAACLIYATDFAGKWRIAAGVVVMVTAIFAAVFVGYMVRHDEWRPIDASSWIDPPEQAAAPAPQRP